MRALCLPILGLLVATAAAQDTPNRFIPEGAQVVLRIAAPAKWKSQFEGTRIAQVFGGQAMAPIMAQLEEGFTGGSEAQELGIDPERLEALWNDYTGDITIALQFDLEDMADAIEQDRIPNMAMVMSLTSDGSYDLAGLAAELGEALENKTDDSIRELTVGDYTLRCNVEDDASASLPTMIDDHLMMVWATNMERDGATMLASDNRRQEVGAGKAMYLHVDAEQGISTLMDIVSWQMENDLNAPPIDVVQLLTDMGLSCLKTLDLTIEADGDQMVLESNLGTSSQNRGLFGSFLLDQGAPKTLRYLPPSAESFACQAFDFKAIYTTIANMWGGFDDIMPMTFDDMELTFEDATKVRLREDLIDHIGTELLYLVDYAAGDDMDPDDFAAFLVGTCYALSLTDGKAFGESLEKALRSRGLHAARKSEDYQGIKIYRLRLAGLFEIEYSITDDLLLLAPGGDEVSRAQLRSILDARAHPHSGVPPVIARYQDDVPAGWNGVGVTPIASLFSQMGDLMSNVPAEELPEGAEMILGMVGQIGAEMKQVGLDEAVQFSYTSASGIRTIMRF